jgi:disease resistance protein RPM1
LASVERLTSLEGLSIDVPRECNTRRWLVKELGSLRELRVLDACILNDEETKRDFVESLRHLLKLQHLTIKFHGFAPGDNKWEATELVLPRNLRHLAASNVIFRKLPSYFDPLCLPNLSHLDLSLEYVDDEDMKILGRLPELHSLELRLGTSATVSNAGDSSDASSYFHKLRCCRTDPFNGLVPCRQSGQ